MTHTFIGKFPLGIIVSTPGAMEKTTEDDRISALTRHHNGDWGDVTPEDRESNNEALEEGYRILSSYTSASGVKFWIITEADRSVTTFLLPEDY
ncbi:hypothetical protein [Paenibacillus sp. 1P03SA]|uniref:hypothetical protein n=1 Tax=Paenibacillus sp. 1P03SA TaxID=3132294 RepID=UPI0039A04642